MATTKTCIFIASHISNPKRIPYLCECLDSLKRQSVPVPVFLSISFENPDLRQALLDQVPQDPLIVIRIRDQKTPQMRHMDLLLQELDATYEWILFCDDDDTYAQNRVARFCELIEAGTQQLASVQGAEITPDASSNELVGLYESTFGKDHREHRHEYWCYCVRRKMLEEFMVTLRQHPSVLEDKCCDVLFAEYLRRSRPTRLFIPIAEPMYHYRVDQNEDSVTGFIKTNQPKYTQATAPPPIQENAASWADYVLDWNEYLYENIGVFVHDTYLRTVVGVAFEDTLRAEFRANYALLEFVDPVHVEKMRARYEEVVRVCTLLYDVPMHT
jgi:hypothetical protein